MVSDNPESFADLDGHDQQSQNSASSAGDCATKGSGSAAACPAQTVAPAAIEETTAEEVNRVAEPLVESAVKDSAAILSKVIGAVAGVAVFLLTPTALNANEDKMLSDANKKTDVQKDESKEAPKPTAASGGSGKSGKGGLPPDVVKLRGGQGYRDKSGNTWKKDQLHKDHWDVTDRKGNKVREVTFDGRQLWPDGPKNNQ